MCDYYVEMEHQSSIVKNENGVLKKRFIYLGRPYKTRIAVTSHRRVTLYGSVEMLAILLPAPNLGLLSI